MDGNKLSRVSRNNKHRFRLPRTSDTEMTINSIKYLCTKSLKELRKLNKRNKITINKLFKIARHI